MGDLETRIQQRIQDATQALGDGGEIVPAGPFTGDALGSVPGITPDIASALRAGLCRPFWSIVDLLVPAGQVGEVPSGFRTDNTGPFAITEIAAFARISEVDQNGADNWPLSLIQPPPQAGIVDPFAANQTAFAGACKSLIPRYDVRGRSIPIGDEHCPFICCGTEKCCFSYRDADGNVTEFSGVVPIVLREHPECLGGTLEVFTNSCAWQFAPIPISLFSPQNESYAFNISQQAPNCFGVCGLLDCSQDVTLAFNSLSQHQFDIVLSVVFAGFRMINGSTASCAIQG